MPGNQGKKKKGKGLSNIKKELAKEVHTMFAMPVTVPVKSSEKKKIKKKGKSKGKGASSGGAFKTFSAPVSVATNISIGGGNSRNNKASKTRFAFRECIMPNIQTTATTQAGGLLSFGDNTAGATLQNCNVDMNPLDTITFGTRITNEANNWEYFRFKQLILKYVTTQSSNTPGQVVLAYDYDPVNPTPPANTEGYRYYTQLDNAQAGSPWVDFQLNVKVAGDDVYPVKKFFTDLNRAADVRQAVQGQIYVVHGSNIPASTKIGQLWIEGFIEFSERVYRPAAVAAGIQGTGGNLLVAGATNYNTLAIPNATYTAANGAITSVVNSPTGQPAILLSPGTYLSDMSIFLSPSTTYGGGGFLFGTSLISSSNAGLVSEVPTVVPKRNEISSTPASAVATTIAAARQEVVSVPFPGAYYTPLITSGSYTGTATPTTITINLSQIASAALGFLTGLFASPLKELAWHKYVQSEMDLYFKEHGTMVGVRILSFGEFLDREKSSSDIPTSWDAEFLDFCNALCLEPTISSMDKYQRLKTLVPTKKHSSLKST